MKKIILSAIIVSLFTVNNYAEELEINLGDEQDGLIKSMNTVYSLFCAAGKSAAANKKAQDALKEDLLESLEDEDHVLRFREDGTFRVLVFSDIHGNSATIPQLVRDNIKTLVDREDPDFIMFDGDVTWNLSTESDLSSFLEGLTGYIEEKEIPWAHVYGNHDDENNALSRKEQQKVYGSFRYCLSGNDDENISGVSNYVLPVLSNDGERIAFNIWAIDSGTYISEELKAQAMPKESIFKGYPFSSYAYVKTDQIIWYYQTSKMLEAINGQKIPAMMCMHIPLQECYNAWMNREKIRWENERNEDFCGSELNSGLFVAARDRGDVKAMVFGHDHVNDFMLDFCGIKLCGCSTVSPLGYWDQSMAGARVLIAYEDGSEIKTYMSYLNKKKVNLDHKKVQTFNDSLLLSFNEKSPECTLSSFKDDTTEKAFVDEILVSLNKERGLNKSGALAMTRSKFHGEFISDNVEVKIPLESPGKLGDNKYLCVWMDLTGDTKPIEFRKANFGLIANFAETRSYSTDCLDKPSEFYYLADGQEDWVTMNHGDDGCFGAAQQSPVKGFKGWFAFPIENMPQYYTGNRADANTVVTGIYFFWCLNEASMAGEHLYIDQVSLVKDYKTINK